MKKEDKKALFLRKSKKKIIFPLGLFPAILFYIQNAKRMKTELLHKYFRGETTEKRGKPDCGMGRKQCRKQGTLSKRANAV